MNKLICILCLVASMVAEAQVVERQKSVGTTDDKVDSQQRQKSRTMSRNEVRTFTLGDLFFERLAHLEQDGARLEKIAPGGDAGKIDSSLPGAWLMSMTCPVLGQRHRYVYGQGSYVEGDFSTGTFAEGNVAAGFANRARRRQGALDLYGEPLFANHYVACIQTYSMLIEQAIKSMSEKGQIVDNVMYLPQLKSSADAALMSAINSYHMTPENVVYLLPIVPLDKETPCLLPTPSGISGGMTTFTCALWRVSQWPLEAVRNSQVILSADTVNGVKYAFADQAELASGQSMSRTKSRSESLKRSEDQKVKVQK